MRVAESVRQFGAFSRAQVFDAGGNDATIRRRRRSGEWVGVAAGVYVDPAFPPCWEQRLWVAFLALGPRAVVARRSAAALWSFVGFPSGPVDLTLRVNSNARAPNVAINCATDLADDQIRVDSRAGPLPVTSPERTILDLAANSSRAHLRLALEEAVILRTVDEVALARLGATLSRPGKPGIAMIGGLLEERAPGPPVPASHLERLLLVAIDRYGLPRPSLQHRFPGRQAVQGCVDAAYPAAAVVLEADGRRWHARRADLGRDRARDNEATRAGWVTLRFMEPELRNDHAGVAATILETLNRRTRRAS